MLTSSPSLELSQLLIRERLQRAEHDALVDRTRAELRRARQAAAARAALRADQLTAGPAAGARHRLAAPFAVGRHRLVAPLTAGGHRLAAPLVFVRSGLAVGLRNLAVRLDPSLACERSVAVMYR